MVCGGLVTWSPRWKAASWLSGRPRALTATSATLLLTAVCRSVPMLMVLSTERAGLKGSLVGARSRMSLAAA